ncbi:MAG: fucose isomerase [Candidatus Izemoplasmataceae bacterium]
MKPFEVLYLPIGVPTFHLESAEKEFNKTKELLAAYEKDAVMPEEMLLSIDKLIDFIEGRTPDLVIIQNVTFAHSAYTTEIFKRLKAPTLLWSLKEPVIDGSRLRLNSLTGGFAAGFAYKHMIDGNLLYTFGAPEDDEVKKKLSAVIRAARIKHQINGMNLAMVGHTPPGFGFGRALDLDMATKFGVNLVAIEARELMDNARRMTLEDAKTEDTTAHKRMKKLDETRKKNREDFIKLYKAYKDFIEENDIEALASRCWPDYFDEYGTAVCGVLGMLQDDTVAAACETDAYGALTMTIGQKLTGEPTYLGDPVSMDKDENTITFWHCGTGACSLARRDTGPLTGVHPNRKIGPTMEFGFKPHKEATIFRIGRLPDGTFRFFVRKGAILDKPKQFLGTSMVVKVDTPVEPLITTLIKEGWEPHYGVIYGDVTEELKALGDMLDIAVYEY